MNQSPVDISKRLSFILHRGLTEIRNLALGEGNQQIADLADALEILPKFIEDCSGDEMELVRFVLKNYQDKYPGRAFDYLAHLEQLEPPARY
jgi:hypothetical protein